MTQKCKSRAAAVLAPLFVLAAVAVAQDAEMSRWTIDGGGLTYSAGGDFELAGTIGQPDAGTMSNGDLTLSGGFWFSVATGDCNVDGGVNLIDLDDFTFCLTGPDGGLGELECRCFDFDEDGDVDLSDMAGLQQSLHAG